MNEITYFFQTHQEFYHYYRLRSTQNDNLYFVRNKSGQIHLSSTNLFNFEPSFSSSHDHLVAQIIANDRIERYLREKIDSIKNKKLNPHVDDIGNINQNKLLWTDSKSSLIELIYALYASGSINNGNCDIRDISEFFESSFQIRLPDIYRTYQDIKIRTSPTKYIDNLKTSLLKKIDDDFE